MSLVRTRHRALLEAERDLGFGPDAAGSRSGCFMGRDPWQVSSKVPIAATSTTLMAVLLGDQNQHTVAFRVEQPGFTAERLLPWRLQYGGPEGLGRFDPDAEHGAGISAV